VKGKVALIANTAWYIYNFRRGLIRELQQDGYAVIAIAPPDEYARLLTGIGARFLPLPMDNKGTNPFKDLRLAFGLRRILKLERPSCALTFTVKPNVFGAFAARSLGIPVIANVSGLGTTFIKRNWVTVIVRFLYRGALGFTSKAFFQNPDDLELFVRGRLVDPAKAQLLPGSGVDVHWFAPPPTDRPHGAFRFLLLGRLLWDKGVGEFVEAAAQLRRKFSDCEFVLMGFTGIDNATAIPMSRIEEWQRSGLLIFVPPAVDVRDQLAQAHCVVLPSYREGTPKALLEAASMARPVITTDVPGCRQVVEDGATGFLARVRDAADLAEKMERMIRLSESERRIMGQRGREKMMREFDERIVVREYRSALAHVAARIGREPIG
jgi:glycosyltransferase involved in cell wall biosynthesis